MWMDMCIDIAATMARGSQACVASCNHIICDISMTGTMALWNNGASHRRLKLYGHP